MTATERRTTASAESSRPPNGRSKTKPPRPNAERIPDTAKLPQAAQPKPNTPKFYNPIALYNLWKPVRRADAASGLFRARGPANWVVETFGAVEGAYKSFFALVKNGDPDARTPRIVPETRFFAIPGCSAFSVKRGEVILAPQIFGGVGESLVFSIPSKY